MGEVFKIIFSSFFLNMLLIYLLIKIGKKWKLYDLPEARKLHTTPTPRLGGIGFVITFFIIYYFFGSILILKKIALSLLILFLLGIYDDLKGADAKIKFFFQILASILVWYNGLKINKFTNPFGDSLIIQNSFLSLLITVFWIVSLINSINLLDGMDGLAGGVIFISSIFIFIIAYISHNFTVVILTSLLIGITASFLLFNFPPAKIFMGDTGSMFLGFTMAIVGIIGNRKSAVAITLLVPIVLLLIPILDTAMAIFRRLKNKKNIFQADKEHIHHRLLALGIGYKKVLLIIYLVNIYLGLIALLSLFFKKEYIFILFIILLTGIFILLEILRFFEKKSKT